jgi:hypothetical protein
VALHGTVAIVSNRACGKEGKKGKMGLRCSLPQRGASKTLVQRWKVAEPWATEVRWWQACAARVYGVRRRLRVLRGLGRGTVAL